MGRSKYAQDPTPTHKPAPARVMARLLASLRPTTGGCLESPYYRHSRGYVRMKWYEGGRYYTALVHRIAYQAYTGVFPGQLTVDHLCFNKACCAEAHLELVTMAENLRRAAERRRAS